PTAARPIATVTVGQLPLGVAVNPSSTRVYVANSWDGTVSVIDTASNTVVATVPVGTNPTGVAVNATGTRVYVANQGTVSVINTATNAVVATISIPGLRQVFGIAINPAGSRVYLSDTAANVVGVIDATSNTFMGVLAVGLAPMGLATDPTGAFIFVAQDRALGTVSVIRAATNTVVATVRVGENPEVYGSFVAGVPGGTASCDDQIAPLQRQIADLQQQLMAANQTIA